MSTELTLRQKTILATRGLYGQYVPASDESVDPEIRLFEQDSKKYTGFAVQLDETDEPEYFYVSKTEDGWTKLLCECRSLSEALKEAANLIHPTRPRGPRAHIRALRTALGAFRGKK
jgi:hypothetical protein